MTHLWPRAVYTSFHELTCRSYPSADFCKQWLKRCRIRQGRAFWKL